MICDLEVWAGDMVWMDGWRKTRVGFYFVFNLWETMLHLWFAASV
jgi:hypothetical protein